MRSLYAFCCMHSLITKFLGIAILQKDEEQRKRTTIIEEANIFLISINEHTSKYTNSSRNMYKYFFNVSFTSKI